MSKHVCILTAVHPPFDGRIFHRQARTLAEAGYRVTLVAPASFESRQEDGIAVLGVPKPPNRLHRPLVWWRLLRQVWRVRPDVVHFHDPELLLLVPLLRLILGRHDKLVYDVHEYFADSLADKYWIPRQLRPIAVWLARRAERLLVQAVNGIVCAADGQKQLYSQFQGPVAVVRNLPRAKLFENPEPHPALAVKGLRLIYVGLILPKRGINVLLEAMRLLHQRGVGDVHLFLIGPDTSPAYIEHIRSFAETHQLADRIHWLGAVPHDQVKNYLANADVGLAPGLLTRQYKNPGIATKLFEYMLAGLPIVSADYPHRRIYIEEANCGLVVPPEDAPAHADAILWLHDHPEEAQAMGARGRAVVLDHYTWEHEQLRLLAFYKELL